MSDTSTEISDCFGTTYNVKHMPKTGFCGFHALSYCLTGNEASYTDIIDDCINVFANIPELFRLRTTFGSLQDSSLNLNHYQVFMQNAVQRVQSGLAIDTCAWCEESHLAALSCLYDIAVCVYSVQDKKWFVFNETGRNGYICLLSTAGHFDVIEGPDSPPNAADTHGITRSSLATNDDLWVSLQREYTFDFVNAFSEDFAGINILNKPVVIFNPEVTATQDTESSDRHARKQEVTIHRCDAAGCTYATDNIKGLEMHKLRVHRENMIHMQKKVYFCDVAGCCYSNIKKQRVALHKSRKHSKRVTDSYSGQVVSNTESVNLTCLHDIQSVASSKSRKMDTETERACESNSIHYDVSSVASVDTNISRRSKRIANRGDADSETTVEESPEAKKIRYICDVEGCESTHDTAKGLSIHKSKRHSGKVCANVGKSIDAMESADASSVSIYSNVDSTCNSNYTNHDVHSLHSVDTNISRRSKRIADIADTNRAESPEAKKIRYMCDVEGCVSSHDSAKGLSIHKSKRHSGKICADVGKSIDAMESADASSVSMYSNVDSMCSSVRRSERIYNRQKTQDVVDCQSHVSGTRKTKERPSTCQQETTDQRTQADNSANNWWQRLPTNTQTYKLKTSFSQEIAQLEKDFKPKNKTASQNDPLYDKLKIYHDNLMKSVTNTTTEKLSSEILDVILDPSVIDTERRFEWSTADEDRLNELNRTCKQIQARHNWTWAADDESEQGKYNRKCMELCVSKGCEWKVIECDNCGSTGILVGDQIHSEVCHDCLKLKRVNAKERQHKEQAWNKVKPVSKQFPRSADGSDLPNLEPGDKAVLAPVHGVVTIKRNEFGDKRLRLESISLVQENPVQTWCKVLPRTNLADRFIIIERRVKNDKKYIVADRDRVTHWLRYLFLHHREFVRLRRQHELDMDFAAVDLLGPNLELAEVDAVLAEHTVSEAQSIENEMQNADDGLTDPTVESGLSETHVFSYDQQLYLKTKDVLKIRKEGKLEILQDTTVRKPSYCTSANLAFPHLYPHGEMASLDFQDYKLGRFLLKKQCMFAHTMSDGKLKWTFADDDVHLAHQFSRLCEQTVRATVGYYLSSHPSVAHVPLENIISAFRDGVDSESGLLDSHLPDLTTVMMQLPNSRQKWFSERLGIEAVSRDVGSPNVFMTINLDCRASPDVHRLLYRLENGTEMPRDEPFMKDTAAFTRLMDKFAPFVAVYLYRKVKAITHAFLIKICGVEEHESTSDWSQKDVTETSFFWGRVEFTDTRGIAHYHFLVRLPNVLETGLLGRIIHNGRVVRQELKCGNIKPEKREQAWRMIEMALLASRYVALFAESISTASFYSEYVGIDDHEDSKVIKLEEYRSEYVQNYKAGNLTLNTHPIMRRFDDPECHENRFDEMADIASVSCLHRCIRRSCGGDPLSGDGCRFDFPKKLLKHTVPAVMQVNANQMEARVLLRRTCDRVPNLNRYLIEYLRSNHDVSVLIDSAHKLRYATKYCAKSGKHAELLDEVIEHLNKRSTDLLPPNMKQVLSHLLLADCSHRAFISKQELAYKVMQLPDTMKSFANVDVVGFYKRANVQVPYDDQNTIEYSDRTEYTAYAERCRDDTELGRGLTKEAVENMCFNEFAETVQHKWINAKKSDVTIIDETTKRKFRTRDVNSGHWRLTLSRRRKHTRPSTVLYTAPAVDYEFVEHGKTTTQTTFYDLSIDRRQQLYRAYYELVMYVPWQNTPDEVFLSADVRGVLDDRDRHAEIDSRHSLQRLEEFFKVYKQYYDDGMVAPPGSAWHKDNQFSYSMFLVSQHNRDVHLDRVDNSGVLKAQYEDVDELVNVDVDVRSAVTGVTDVDEYPIFENFMPPDSFRDIMEQKAPAMSEISVAFPMQNKWQRLEELVTHCKSKRFIADPPKSPVKYSDMTKIQKFAVDRGKDKDEQIVFLCGQAGSGKTATALKICEYFAGKVQAVAFSGKAASLFNGPTIHSMFGFSHHEHKSTSAEIKDDSKKVTEFRVAHEHIELYVIEEALAVPAAYFALMDEMMTAAFNPKRVKNARGEVLPFGGKKMVFLGDQAQLPPIAASAVYDDGRVAAVDSVKSKRESKQSRRTKTGQLLFEKYLVPNCIYLHRGQRNSGLLGEICDRMRQGKSTEDDCAMLTYQRTRFPDVSTDFGIHYQNEMCTMHNWRHLWNVCKQSDPPRRMFICKATYHVTADNGQIVEGLSTLPPQAYDYAPDVLCVADGCDVRLLHNLNISAGLVTSQSGTVVKVIFNNADVNLLLAGEHVVPYCIVVAFPGFHGFVDNSSGTDRRIYPFPSQPTWVPVFRKRFSVKISYLPTWIRKKQLEKECYRIQFPLDLASNITAHRAQGQTMANCLVSVDLGLDNPDMKMPVEISSLLYVACTRVTKLANLFVSAIHPSVWQRIGQSDVDKYRRTVDDKLQKGALDFAMKHGMYREMLDELAWTADRSNNAEEWRLLQQQTQPPLSDYCSQSHSQQSICETDFKVDLGDVQFLLFCRPVLSERHIGIDQGVKNFAIVVVERMLDQNPNIVAAKNYTELQLKNRFKACDVLVALSNQTDLLFWMNPRNGNDAVGRVVVHLEQIDKRNRNAKQFSVELGRLLQQQAVDPNVCIVQMSSPHVHRCNGPLFHLGDEIVEKLQLKSATYLQQRSRAERNPSVVGVQHADVESEPSDVEPADQPTNDHAQLSESHIYRAKKKISSNVFRYVIEADNTELQQMKLTIDKNVQDYWRKQIASDSSVKVDDVGDALLHALDEILCGSSNFRQLIPAAPTVHVNRTVAVAVFPDTTYWIVLNCRWNTFVLENLGYFSSCLENCFYKDPSTVAVIKSNMVECDDISCALSLFEGNATYDPVDHIKVVVKQLTGHTELLLKNQEAGALTDATTKSMKQICDNVIGRHSNLIDRRDRLLGSTYCRTSTVHRDRKYQVVCSTGKHTNAILSILSWFKQNLREFVDKRREFLSEGEKKTFFRTLLNIAHSSENSVEMLQLSDTAKTRLCSDEVTAQIQADKTFGRNIADLVLIAMSKNQRHVKAVAANSRKLSALSKSAALNEQNDDSVEH